MNPLIEMNQVQTMGTSEIAKLVGITHTNLKISYRRLLKKGVLLGGLAIQYPYKTSDGQEFKEYRLNKRNSIILVAQNCPEFTAVLVDRWQELERQVNEPKLPQNYKQALIALVEAEEERERQQLLIEQQKPYVQFCEQVSQAKNDLLIRDFAKALSKDGFKIGQNRLFDYLRENKVLMSNNQPYQRYIDNGYFNVVTRIVQTNHGNITKYTPMVTGKGQLALSKKLLKEV